MSDLDDLGARLRATAAEMPDNPLRAEQLVTLDRRLRQRRRQRAVVSGTTLLTVAAIGLIFGLVGPRTTGTIVPATTTAPVTGPQPTPDESRRIELGRVSFIPPEGWSVAYTGKPSESLSVPATSAPAGEKLICLLPAARAEHLDESVGPCGDGIQVQYGVVVGSEGKRFEPHQPAGWSHGRGTTPCPVSSPGATENWAMPGSPGANEPAPVRSGEWRTNGLIGTYDRWAAYCLQSGYTYSPESWYLPQVPFQVLDYLGHTAETAQILASLRVE